jgi:hypothetical protein
VAKSFEEGQAQGGAVLWTEPPERFDKRFKEIRQAQLGIGGLLLFPFVLMCAFSVWAVVRAASAAQPVWPAAFPFVLASAPTWLAAGLGILLIQNGRHVDRLVKPEIVYVKGVSLGQAEKPYYPFEEVVSVDEARGTRFETTYIVVAFRGGEYLQLANADMRGGVQMVGDLDVLRKAIADAASVTHDPEVAWDVESRGFTNGLRWMKGPVRVKLERIATERGVRAIDLAFLRAHWRRVKGELDMGAVPTWRSLLKQSREAAQKSLVSPPGTDGNR